MLRKLGFVWSLPLTLAGLVISVFCGPTRCEWRDGCVEIIVRRWVRGFGTFTCGRTILYRSDQDPSYHRAHEHSHARDCDLWGVLIVPAYGIASLISRLRGTGWYWGNWFEARARRAALLPL
jgi:hypothetical protein